MDPLADKLMVIAAMLCIIYRSHNDPVLFNIFMPLVMITVFRELAVTSIRLVAIKNANIVVAANMHGKVKTVTQIVCIMSALLEPVLAKIGFLSFLSYYPITIVAAALTLFMTIWSGWIYLSTYWKYLDQDK
jgi:CDP-diacylglycerol--glycerol-3-phosphate 3-phosphatidyltransferase